MIKRGIVAIICLLVGLSIWAAPAIGAEQERNVTVLFTHDLHANVLPKAAEPGAGQGEKGGFARIKTAADRVKAENHPVVLVDGGDFSMGTLYQTLFATDGADLRLLGAMGYDATTLGNHEFDMGPEGLAAMFQAAKASGDPLPQVVQANIVYPEQGGLQAAAQNLGVQERVIIEKDGVKIGIFGLLGEDADECAPNSGCTFKPIEKIAKEQSEALRAQGAELIICLSHSGTGADLNQSEDVRVAKAAPEIDVIVSGHTHTVLEEPIVVGNTIIGSAGEYGAALGRIDLRREGEGWVLTGYQHIAIDDGLQNDSSINRMASVFREGINSQYLAEFGYEYDTILTESGFDFTPFSQFAKEHREDTLGNLIADSYRYAVAQATGVTPDVAVVPSGCIRDSLYKGKVTVSDVFNVSPLGFGSDGKAGYPLILAYVTGKELKAACEVDASVSPMMESAQLYMSGLHFAYNPNRMILDKVTRTELFQDGAVQKLEDDKLYSVVCDIYTAQMLGAAEEKSFGLLSIVPKNASGELVTDLNGCIVKGQDGKEVKAWLALASYLESFGQEGVPDKYEAIEGRKLSEPQGSLLANPGFTTSLAIGVCVAVFLALGFVVYRICTRKRRKAKKAQK